MLVAAGVVNNCTSQINLINVADALTLLQGKVHHSTLAHIQLYKARADCVKVSASPDCTWHDEYGMPGYDADDNEAGLDEDALDADQGMCTDMGCYACP